MEREFLRKLVQARLVRVEDIDGRPRYELAHEFLVQQIGTWIADSERELTKVLELIDRAYEAYRATELLLEPEALALIAPFQDELVVPVEKQRFLDLSRQTARRRRRGLWLRVGALLLLVGLGVGGFFYVRLLQSKQQLETTNVNLKQALQESEAQTRLANHNLAAALLEKGTPLFAQWNWLSSYIHLAKALALDPTLTKARSLAYHSAIFAPYVHKNTIVGHEMAVRSIAFSPDGRTLAAAAGGGDIRVWGLPEGTLLAIHEGKGAGIAFSPDGRILASAAGDGIALWRLPEDTLLKRLRGHTEEMLDVAFSPDGRTLASASKDETIGLWPLAFLSLSPEAFYRQAQLDTGMRIEGLVARNLTVAEWQALKQKTADLHWMRRKASSHRACWR